VSLGQGDASGRSELEALLALQEIDTRIDQERYRRAHLPERGELGEVAKARAETEAARAQVAASLEDVARRQASAEAELRATEERMNQVNARLYGGTVTASREQMAMIADLEGLRKRASELEDRALLAMEEREPLDSAIAAADKALAELADRGAEVASRLSKAEGEVDKVLAALEKEREAAASAVSPASLAAYESLRARLGGVAVARLVGGRCDGCHLSLPAVDLDRIRHQPPGTLAHCEQCGRVLVLT
jgi:predicted  nucleic acid-binding Zn-ribbon protein